MLAMLDLTSFHTSSAQQEHFIQALLHADRASVQELIRSVPIDCLLQWKTRYLMELTDQVLSGRAPFCLMTAAAYAAEPLAASDRHPVCAVGAVETNPGSSGCNYMLMLLHAWGIPTLNLGTSVRAETFLTAVKQYQLPFLICVTFLESDLTCVREVHAQAVEQEIRPQFQLLTSGVDPQRIQPAVPVDCKEYRAAALARWVVKQWNH